jgi:two-component system, LytTR family, sensor kinase
LASDRSIPAAATLAAPEAAAYLRGMSDAHPFASSDAAPRIGLRVVIVVCLAWVFLGLVWGAQTTMGAIIRGVAPVPLGTAIRTAFIQTLPWIPVTLAAIALTRRFPLSRGEWRRHLPVHIGAAAVLAFVANVLVVAGYWMTAGMFNGVRVLMQQGLLWATVNLHVALLIYATVVAVTQGALYYQRTRARELQLARIEGQLARARLQALTAQIRPHFLFNTLHTIGQLWRSGQSDDADAVLDQLGSLFSRVQTSTSKLEVPLGEELELVKAYLAIEEARFRDRLRTNVDASGAARDCLVPPLILQPLVENAIRHGVSAISSAGRVGVSAALENGNLLLTVTDDGPGVGARSSQPGSGTGLRNTRERLAQLYGDDAELRIDSPANGGTVVTVRIPASRGARDAGPSLDG